MCEINSGDFEEWKVHSETVRRARKQYRCDTCGGSIPKGTFYRAHFSVAGNVYDRPCSEKACLFCAAAHDDFADEHAFSTTPSYFQTVLAECFYDANDPNPRWGVMLAAMRDREVAFEDLYGAAA